MKLLTVLGVFLLITTGTWAYSRNCAKGPEYWCRDASTAKACGAVRHCEQTVWRENQNNKPSMTTKETAEMLCNVLVQASKKLLDEKKVTVNSIKEYLRRDCTNLPNENNLIQHCEMAVDIYLSDILRHIQTGTESNKICPIIQGHDAASSFVPKPKINNLTSNATCVLCEFVLHLVEAAASANASEQELIKIFEQVCTKMPETIRGECKDFVDTYAADIIALLVREVDPAKVCELIKICPKPKNVAFLTKPSLQTCGLCDYISTYVTAGYPIDNVCTHFSTDDDVRQQCEVLVHLYKPNICPQLPLCFDETPSEQPNANPVECSLCKYVVTYVDTIIQNNRTEAAIEAALEKVCTILPHALNSSCVQFVENYGPILVQLLEKYTTPDQVCVAIKACANKTQEVPLLEQLRPIEPKQEIPNSLQCTLCEFIINYVNKAIGNNRTVAAIDAALEKVCDILPSSLRPNCTSFVDKFGLVIAVLLIKNESAEQVCDFIKVCNNGTQELPRKDIDYDLKFVELSDNSAECSVCKYVVTYVDHVIENNRTEAAVEAALEKVCTILPHSLNASCVQFVVTFGPQLIQLLEKHDDPVKVCDALKLCNNGTEQIAPAQPLPKVESIIPSVNSLQCTLCEFIINYVNKAIGNNRTVAAIDAALEKVCDILPSSVRPNCTSFVDKFGLVIAVLMIKNESAEQVCDFIKVCNNGTQAATTKDTEYELKFVEPSDNSAECSVCKYVVTYVAHVIEDNKTEAAIEAALEKVCTILPHSLNASCVQFVVTFGPQLVQLIEKYDDPVKVCDALKLCNNGTEQVAPAQSIPKIESVNSLQCTLCEFIINYVNKAIGNNRTVAAIDAALEKVCDILPSSLRPNCTSFVDKFGLVIAVLLIKNESAEQVCDFIKVCNNGTQEVPRKDIDYDLKFVELSDNSAECSVCKYVVTYVDHVIENNRTEAAVEAALEKVCTILPHSLNASCVQFVVTFGPQLIQLLEKYDDPVKVCDALKLCNNGTEQIAPAQPLPKVESITPSVNSLQCTLCEFIINYVNKAIGNNRTVAAIDAALEKVCDILPSSLRPNCTSFVDKFGLVIAVLLIKNESAEQVCDFIKVCNNGTQEIARAAAAEELKIEEPSVGTVECSVCKFVVTYIDTIIQNNKSEAAIEAALEKVCTIVPHSLNSSCYNFVESYGPVLVQLLELYTTPDQVCAALKLCQNGTQILSIQSAKTSKYEEEDVSSPQCSLCKLVLTYLDAIIENNKTEAAIEAALEKVCTILPSDKKAECVQFVDTYGTKLVELLEKFGSPKLVCMALGLCVKNAPEVPLVKSVGSPQCTLCKYVISYVEAVIQTNKSEAAIDAALEKVCTILPHALNHSCIQFIDTYGPQLIEYIAKSETPGQVCDAIKVCNNGTVVAETVPQVEMKPVKDTPECTLCRYVVSFINTLIESNATEQEIEKGLEVVCKILPESSHAKCDSFVKTYGPIIPQLIAELDDPNVVCVLIGLCKKSDDKFIEIPSPNLQKNQTLPCTLCQYLVNYLDAIIQSNSTETKFEQELEKACKILPSTKSQAECKSLVDLFGTDIIKLLVELGNPKLVCQELGICDK